MFKLIISVAGCICLAALLGKGEAVKCYHCYESFNESLSLRSLKDNLFGSKFVRCDKNKNNWNTWTCPVEWPICTIVLGKVGNHSELLRTCAEKDFCSKYKPPAGVVVQNCQECNTTLCNDYFLAPDPPVDPDALFTFNININLKLNKYLNIDNEDSE